MYEEYYGFTARPFSLAPDPAFLYRSESHEAALNSLLTAIHRREGFVVLTGDVGTGKTLVWRTAVGQLDPYTFTAVVLNPFVSEIDLLAAIVQDFGIVSRDELRTGRLAAAGAPTLVGILHEFLLTLVPLNATAVVIIEEAQNLSPRALEQLRVLTNLETDREKLLQIVLVGQPELEELLDRHEMRQLRQRVSRWCNLRPLSSAEVQEYVTRRLYVARGTWDVHFTPSAIQAIATRSGGVPRTINLLCDRALENGCAARTATITPDMVAAAARSLKVEGAEASVDMPAVRSERRSALKWAAAALLALAGAAALFARSVLADVRPPAPPPPPRAAHLTQEIRLQLPSAGDADAVTPTGTLGSSAERPVLPPPVLPGDQSSPPRAGVGPRAIRER